MSSRLALPTGTVADEATRYLEVEHDSTRRDVRTGGGHRQAAN